MKKLAIIIFLSIVLLGCSRSHLNDVETLMNTSLNGKVCYLTSEEYWQTFGGDGYRVEVYKILDTEYLKSKCESDNYDSFDNNLSINPEYSKYINNGAGYYKRIYRESEIIELTIDTINNKLIYYYCYL
ncbi:MAG: hypothetical protein IJG81_00495 [Muribaculaceae bacterium]|nr:hypothetical protein [Muribaculaceae bacterium]